MKIFLAGASGVIGRSLVPRLTGARMATALAILAKQRGDVTLCPAQRPGCRHGGALALRPADARILDPMAELIVDDEDLVVHLTLGEKIWGFHGDIRVRLSSIVSVAPDPKPGLGLRGWRMAGVSFVGHAVLGTRRHGDGYDFCILHRDRPAVRVDVASGRFSRLVICVPEGGDPEAEAARIAAATGIAPSATVS